MDTLFIGVFFFYIASIIFQRALKRKFLSAPINKQKGLLTKITLIAWGLLIFYASISINSFVSMLKYPAYGSWDIVVLSITCPGILLQLSVLLSRYRKKTLPSRPWTIRIVLTVLGIVLAGQLMKTAESMAMKKFVSQTEALVQTIEKSMPNPCETTYNFLLNNRPDTFFSLSALYYNEQDFLILYPGGSIDLDGSTVYYHSKKSRWNITHNDNSEKAAIYHIGDDLQECEIEWPRKRKTSI